ncbi:MAG: extensin family protein [Myxococcales bacterium]|nr:extensin family protein [Myxococcales bacterium]
MTPEMASEMPHELRLLDVPAGRSIANLEEKLCYELLETHSIAFEHVSQEEASEVEMPIRLMSPVGGVTIEGHHHGPSMVLDCRLAIAILAWSDSLREAHVGALRHFSIYRAHAVVAGTGKLSGHARGLAIDLAALEFDNGAVTSVLDDWHPRQRGRSPCDTYPNEPELSTVWRILICETVSRDLFQVVLTPHHDSAHANHVHLEVVPKVDWSYIR